MCGRFVSARKRLELLEEFGVERDRVAASPDPEPAPDYNVAPTKKIFAVLERPAREDEPQARELRVLRWGLVPSWAKEASIGSRMINARAETVAVKPAFRRAFTKRRCILPADGYYEWQAISDGGKKRKQPYFIYRTDGGALAFAGIYELWRDDSLPDDHERAWLWTAAIITTQATDDVGQIHDRMPMVITPEHWADWLDPANTEPGQIHAAMLPAMAGGLTSHPVSMAVNTVRNNGPELIKPLESAMGQARLPLAVRGRPASCSESAAAAMAWCQSKPALPTARGREARTPVETTVARKRLEEMRDDLDRTIAVLQGERPGPVAGTGYPRIRPTRGPFSPRPTAPRRSSCPPASSVTGCSPRCPASTRPATGVRGLRPRDTRGQARRPPRRRPLRRLPVQVGQAPPLVPISGASAACWPRSPAAPRATRRTGPRVRPAPACQGRRGRAAASASPPTRRTRSATGSS